jgi:ubiquinone/menaquinone biosynthesis C-methylase UbiE
MKEAEVKEYVASQWNAWASKYDKQYAHGIKTEEENRAWRNLLEGALGKPPQKVLDVGTGTGFLAILATGLGHNCLGLDLSEEMLHVARVKAAAYLGKVAFTCGDAENLDLPDKTFDVVMNRHLLWTLPKPEVALKEWYRVLKPGGRVIIINAAWSTFGLGNRLISWLGKLLILLTELRNPWSGGYEKSMVQAMPLFTRVKPARIKKILADAGFDRVSFTDMHEVCAAEYNAMPLRYRMAYRHERYTITAVKPS